LTKPPKRYILVYVDVTSGKTTTLGMYSSLVIARRELEERSITTGQLFILSDTNRVIYSKKGGDIDAE
tara:strand:- start:773 stop:976 length:204 start_codon:yes stop_codon:yes gene_type:complete